MDRHSSQADRSRLINHVSPPCLWRVPFTRTKERSNHVHMRSRTGAGTSVLLDIHQSRSVKIAECPARFHPARTRHTVTNSHSVLFKRVQETDGSEMPWSTMKETIMKIVVIGGTGLIGSKLVNKLREHGHEAVAAAPNTGVNTLTGEGLAEVLKDASVVVDVSNSPSWEDSAVLKFFETSTRHLLGAEAAEGVGHHVALSIVGTDRLLESGYFRAKIAQENLIKSSSIPYSIVRATQFFEFVKGISDFSTVENKVRLPHAFIQPMAANDVASALDRIATGAPVNGTVEIGGPEKFRLDELVRRGLATRNDPREGVADPQARYYGAALSDNTLVRGDGAQLGETRLEYWLR